MILELLTELASPIWVDIVLFVGAALGAYFVGMKKGNASMKKKMHAMEDDIKLIKKILILKSKLIDEQTKRLHPDEALELEDIVKNMFEDEK